MTNAVKAGMYKRKIEEDSPDTPVINSTPALFERIKSQDGKILDVPRMEYITFLENQILELKKKSDKQEGMIAKLMADMKRTQAATRKLDRSLGEKVDRQ